MSCIILYVVIWIVFFANTLQYETAVDLENPDTLQPVAYHMVNRRYSEFLNLQTRLEEKPELRKILKREFWCITIFRGGQITSLGACTSRFQGQVICFLIIVTHCTSVCVCVLGGMLMDDFRIRNIQVCGNTGRKKMQWNGHITLWWS